MSEQTAKLEAVAVAEAILDGTVGPYEGARRIWMDIWPMNDSEEWHHLLAGFIGEASQWEEHPEVRSEIEAGIRSKAEMLVREWGPLTKDNPQA